MATDLDALGRRANPSRWVDLQDLTVAGGPSVVATGVGAVPTPAGRAQVGGLVVVDADALAPTLDVPVPATMPSGRVATYNGAHVGTTVDGPPALTCLVDDQEAALTTWRAAAG